MGLEAPFENADIGVEWERLGRVLEANKPRRFEKLLVNIGVGLNLNTTLVLVGQLEPNAAELLVCNAEQDDSVQFETLHSTISSNSDFYFLLLSQVYAEK